MKVTYHPAFKPKSARLYDPDFNPKARPLIKACAEGNLRQVKALIKAGVPFEAVGYAHDGYYPLHMAAECGQSKVVSYLIKCGARIDVRTAAQYEQHSDTPLIKACFKGEMGTAQALIDAGADVNATALTGCSPLSGAIAKNHQKLFELLLKHGSQVRQSHLRRAVSQGNIAIAEELLARGLQLEGPEDESGGCLLQCAIATHGAQCRTSEPERNQLPILEFLLNAGVRINQLSGDFGETPLIEAARRGKWDIVKLLLQKGANPNLPSKYNAWALNYAARRGGLEAAELLL